MTFKLFLLFENFLMILPKSIRKLFFVFLAKIAYFGSKKYRNVAKSNLKFLFEDRFSEKEIDEITRYSFKNLLFNFLHLLEMRRMSKEELAKKINVKNVEVVNKVKAQNRPIVFIASHYCSWELGNVGVGAFGTSVASVYRRLKNEPYEKWLLETRSMFGNTNLEMHGVAKPLMKLMKKGLACGILIDTNISNKDGLIVEFMGKKIRQTSTPAFLARKFDAAIIPVSISTKDEEKYTLEFHDEIKIDKTEDEKADILKSTQDQADWLASLLTKEPKFWFWLHRRFKNDYSEIYDR